MRVLAPLQLMRGLQGIVSLRPRYATFIVNTGCNRRCKYCVVPEQGSGVELPPESWRDIANHVANWGVQLISILGGEPTLRKDLPEIVGYVAKRAVASLTSNGDTLVGDKGKSRLAILASQGLSVLNLSLHDLTETGRQIETLRYARRIGLVPILITVVTKATIRQLPDVMKAANERGIFYKYTLLQELGGRFSASATGLAPTSQELNDFVAIVREQRRKSHLVRNSKFYMAHGTSAYPRGWHCNVNEDHWVIVDNEGKLLACNEYPTGIPVLEIPTLGDPRWTEARRAKRTSCAGCTYQCFMEEEGLGRLDVLGETVDSARGLFESRNRS